MKVCSEGLLRKSNFGKERDLWSQKSSRGEARKRGEGALKGYWGIVGGDSSNRPHDGRIEGIYQPPRRCGAGSWLNGGVWGGLGVFGPPPPPPPPTKNPKPPKKPTTPKKKKNTPPPKPPPNPTPQTPPLGGGCCGVVCLVTPPNPKTNPPPPPPPPPTPHQPPVGGVKEKG